MKTEAIDLEIWARHIRQVFPYSDAIPQEDVQVSTEQGKLILKVRANKFILELVPQLRDSDRISGGHAHRAGIFLTEEISAQNAEKMRVSNVPFIDSKGNAFIRLPDLYLFVMGRKQAVPSPHGQTTRSEGKLFKKSGIQLIFLFLTDPRLDGDPKNAWLNSNVRQLAAEAGLSSGSVSELLAGMKERNFLITDGRERILINRKKLFDSWMHGYEDFRLKRKRLCFTADSISWWRERHPAKEGFRWGGEPAAALLTQNYLRPEKLTLYTDQPLYDLVVEANLHQAASDGVVEFLAPLPGADQHGNPDCVHPLLVYADLICSGDNRNAEVAKRIYDEHLRRTIETD